ncbi:MAG: AmmeMemoRadiSam system protein A [Planctomycetota bacterium]|nr:MAG: AmmeMemoRadiSam system protein A [Planctomycetota bacterium]
MWSTNDTTAQWLLPLSEEEQRTLLETAKASIRFGMTTGHYLPVDPKSYPSALRQEAASFVTLHRAGRLRGCIGTVLPTRPLIQDVAINAYHAAFDDPRFPPLQSRELDDLDIEISILSPMSPIEFSSEADLLRKIRPGVDGLLLQYGRHQGLLLPAVWKSLPEVEQFWQHLKLKAGLPPNFWSPNLRVFRFTTQTVSQHEMAAV